MKVKLSGENMKSVTTDVQRVWIELEEGERQMAITGKYPPLGVTPVKVTHLSDLEE